MSVQTPSSNEVTFTVSAILYLTGAAMQGTKELHQENVVQVSSLVLLVSQNERKSI